MTQIAVNPFTMNDVNLKVGDDNYEQHVSSVTFTPPSSTVNWKGLAKNSFTFPTTATWTCVLAYAQDWKDTDSLSRYLHDNEGTQVAAEFIPVNGGPTVTATLIIVPGAIGGAVDNVADASVTLGVQGKPVFTDPTTTTTTDESTAAASTTGA